MKAVILAGGLGTRISEETHLRPKPMIEIGGYPMLWHIMKIYSQHGINDFVICLGYKGYMIKEFFANYALHVSDVTFDFDKGAMEVHRRHTEPWRVTLVDTGQESMTGGRMLRVKEYVQDETFCMTYGDAVSDIDITALVDHHKKSGKKATVTAIQPPGRYGVLNMDDVGGVTSFHEKPKVENGWINGGYFVLEPSVLDYIQDDSTFWELDPMRNLVAENQFNAYRHEGFWQCVDTLREKNILEDLWSRKSAPWKTWA